MKIKSLARSALNVRAICAESRNPFFSIDLSSPAMVDSSVNTPSTPGSVKSVWVLVNVAVLIGLSLVAAL